MTRLVIFLKSLKIRITVLQIIKSNDNNKKLITMNIIKDNNIIDKNDKE